MAHDVKFEFKARNEQAIAAAEKNAARLVTAVSDETKNAIRNIVSRSIREGIPPREAAKMIRGSIGLDSTQTAGAANYRAELKLSGLSEERIDKAYEFYTAKKIRERSVRIARTEVLGALNAGSLESWKQAQQDGLLPANARKKWIVTNDELLRQCPVCRPMNGQEQPFGKKFVLPSGKKIMFPPAHPNCRCTMGDPSTGPRTVTRLIPFVQNALPSWMKTGKLMSASHIDTDDFHVTDVFDMVLGEGSAMHRAVFKPPDFEEILGGLGRVERVAESDTPVREVLAAALGKILGVPIPKTGFRTFSRQDAASFEEFKFFFDQANRESVRGMLQSFIPDSIPLSLSYTVRRLKGIPLPNIGDRTRDAFAIFDYAIGNGDRHGENVMLELPGLGDDIALYEDAIRARLRPNRWTAGKSKIWGIDHGFAFKPNPSPALGPNALAPWWHERRDEMELRDVPGRWREITRDSSDYFMDKLGSNSARIIDLVRDTDLSLAEKNAFLNRLATVTGAVRLRKLGFLFRQTFRWRGGS